MAYHTYEFLKKRRNDPKWREAYISARNKKIISFLVLGNLFFWGAILWRYIERNDIDVMSYIYELKQRIIDQIN
ncbi:hypothetical protein UAW_01742 [Enterococcus haemoperoxidus ATCC BAA-382]|uniref:Uncharacterized protein n=1 Tax=Enterococcus haemoperoxidus ATCC BAA-382 TaxID=1158608 RepID=R2T963_9ENTE|nr:hypothetical protein UAW_01742 [Enterococcus haemoperoxidus ATCC BAA-382]EOT60073.1 hypothetical protein I583_02708 [Enterococcus haemoperoxidus ATCC BAA-382]